jgi:hypothetical protein
MLRQPRKEQSCQKHIIDFQLNAMGKKSKNDFSGDSNLFFIKKEGTTFRRFPLHNRFEKQVTLPIDLLLSRLQSRLSLQFRVQQLLPP